MRTLRLLRVEGTWAGSPGDPEGPEVGGFRGGGGCWAERGSAGGARCILTCLGEHLAEVLDSDWDSEMSKWRDRSWGKGIGDLTGAHPPDGLKGTTCS